MRIITDACSKPFSRDDFAVRLLEKPRGRDIFASDAMEAELGIEYLQSIGAEIAAILKEANVDTPAPTPGDELPAAPLRRLRWRALAVEVKTPDGIEYKGDEAKDIYDDFDDELLAWVDRLVDDLWTGAIPDTRDSETDAPLPASGDTA